MTGDLYRRAPLTIERGRPDEATRVDPSKATFQLNNRANKYSPRNPRSANYGLIGRNTPVRFSVAGPESYLATTGVSGDIVATPDHASLDIVGDIDVRIELTKNWDEVSAQALTGPTLIGKWSAVDGNRSWIWRTLNNFSHFVWSPTGLSAGAITASVELPQLPHRAALRATLDVDNGASGWTVTLYWAETLAGPWTLAGTATGSRRNVDLQRHRASRDRAHPDHHNADPLPVAWPPPPGRGPVQHRRHRHRQPRHARPRRRYRLLGRLCWPHLDRGGRRRDHQPRVPAARRGVVLACPRGRVRQGHLRTGRGRRDPAPSGPGPESARVHAGPSASVTGAGGLLADGGRPRSDAGLFPARRLRPAARDWLHLRPGRQLSRIGRPAVHQRRRHHGQAPYPRTPARPAVT